MVTIYTKFDWQFLQKVKVKSGGARVISYLIASDNEVYLVFIYDKSQLENIAKEQIFELVKKAGLL